MVALVRLAALVALLLALASSLIIKTSEQKAPKGPKFELKFQNEPDINSTHRKLENQQQVFRCQAKLAQSQSGSHRDRRLRSHAKPVSSKDELSRLVEGSPAIARAVAAAGAATGQSAGPPSRRSQPLQVSLTIEWLRNGKPLDLYYSPGSIQRQNIELKSNQTSAKNDTTGAGGGGKKAKLDIKSISNSHQLKLASRLKIGNLRANDSGSFKCIARARFYRLAPSGANDSLLLNVDQELESNEVSLQVDPSDSDQKGKLLVVRIDCRAATHLKRLEIN